MQGLAGSWLSDHNSVLDPSVAHSENGTVSFAAQSQALIGSRKTVFGWGRWREFFICGGLRQASYGATERSPDSRFKAFLY
jgi:hypothetical protein